VSATRLVLSALAWGAMAVGAPAAAAELHSSRGPVDVVVRLSPDTPLIGDVLDLELEARADDGVELLMPEFGEALDRFVILDFSSHEDLDDEGRTRAVQHYVLEPPFSGAHAIPPLLVEFIDRRPGAKSAPEGTDAYELLTERLEFEVASVLPGGALPELRPPPPSLARLGPPLLPTWGWVVAGGLVLGIGLPLGAWAWIAWSARRKQRSAYEVARAELDALLARPRPGLEAIDGFYVELSGIVRRYVERRFDLRSPELTTEEFFVVASESPDLTLELRALLHEFLSRADLVKFAGHRPGNEEVDDSLAAAGRVLEETRVLGETQAEVGHMKAAESA
jgi:hypothetical protein